MYNPCENKPVKLENGTVISNLGDIGSRWDLSSQFEHIKQYFQHGIEVMEGDTVFDVGANVGIFSLMVYDMCKHNADIYAFEPVHATYCDLDKNFINMNNEQVLHAYPFGFSDKEKEIEITHYPNAPGLSTLYPDTMNVALKQMIENVDENIDSLPDFFVNKEEVQRDGNQSRFNKIRTIWGLKSLFEESKITCKMKTLSSFLKEQKIKNIDLLKIDTNGSECDILSGLESSDLQNVRQVVIEIPLGEEHLKQVQQVLRENGFDDIAVDEQPPVVNKGLSYFILFAKRKKDRKNIERKVSKIVEEVAGYKPEIYEQMELDSSTIIDLIAKLEDEFSLAIDDSCITAGEIATISGIVNCVMAELEK